MRKGFDRFNAIVCHSNVWWHFEQSSNLTNNVSIENSQVILYTLALCDVSFLELFIKISFLPMNSYVRCPFYIIHSESYIKLM